MSQSELKKLREECGKSLSCLYIAVEQSVAENVNQKVWSYIWALEEHLTTDPTRELTKE